MLDRVSDRYDKGMSRLCKRIDVAVKNYAASQEEAVRRFSNARQEAVHNYEASLREFCQRRHARTEARKKYREGVGGFLGLPPD